MEDDGDGFDTASVARGSGLTNMVDRLEALGGVLRIRSSRGLTVVSGTLPTAALAKHPVAV